MKELEVVVLPNLGMQKQAGVVLVPIQDGQILRLGGDPMAAMPA
jgi:hypothetical protein